MNAPTLNYQTPHGYTVTLSEPTQLVNSQGYPCIDGGSVRHNGQKVQLMVRIDNKPELPEQVAAFQVAWKTYQEWRTNNVPGLKELRKAQDAAANDNERYHRSFERMMDDEGNDGARPPRRIDESLAEKATRLATQYPRAAMYLQAEGFTYASAVAKYSAGKKAMELISTGGSIAEADEILRSWNSDFWN
jgi:hypothetical protein